MKRLLAALALVASLTSVLAAQEHPAKWNRMTSEEQAVWLANCRPPLAAMATMCAAYGTAAPQEHPGIVASPPDMAAHRLLDKQA